MILTNNEKRNKIFRLSAVLYADNNNNNISTKSIIRKIIETVLCEHNNALLTIDELVEYCRIDYSLIFTVSEIGTTIGKYNEYFNIIGKGNNKKYNLRESRFTMLNNKETKNIDNYIDEFIENSKIDVKYKEIIYRYLHKVLTSNIETYKAMLSIDATSRIMKGLDEFANDKEFANDEIDVINGFLDWENTKKNKAVFDLISYGIEYCLISGDKNNYNSSLGESLHSKKLYLDTNIMFRLIGLNGDDRRRRIERFIEKCLDSKQNLYISLFTKKEFEKTIENITNAIAAGVSKGISVNLYSYFQDDSFISYYEKWSANRVNSDYKLFKAHLYSQFEEIQKKYKINIDYNTRKIDSDENRVTLQSYKNSLIEYSPNKKEKAALYDVENIQLIERTRDRESKSIYGVSSYFITTDHKLCSWDIGRKDNYPIALLPSHWYALLLRYDGRRQADDYTSFVSFINLNHNNELLPFEKQTQIIQGISEIASDELSRKYILEEMVKKPENYNLICMSSDEIKRSGESILSKRIDELNRKVKNGRMKNEENEKKIEELKNKVTGMEKEREDNKEEIEDLKERDANNKSLKKYKYFSIILLCAILWGMAYYYVEKTYNISPLSNGLFTIFTGIIGWICTKTFTKLVDSYL